MTKSLSVASVIEKNRIASDTPWLICIDIILVDPTTGTTFGTERFVRNTEDVTFGGNVYTAAAFDIDLKSEAGSMSNIKLTFTDYTLAIQSVMQQYGGGVGFGVTVMVVNAGALANPPEIIEHFDVVGASSSNYVCSFELGAENSITKSFPRRHQAKDFCQWRFRGEECGYTGASITCDLSLNGANGCSAHGNVVRFGAFPGINTRDVSYG